MMSKIGKLAILAIAIVGIAASEDYISVTNAPPIKDLGNLSQEEISAIFTGNGQVLNMGVVMYTASQSAFLEDNEEDGRPMGNVSPKHAYLGSSNNLTPRYPV